MPMSILLLCSQAGYAPAVLITAGRRFQNSGQGPEEGPQHMWYLHGSWCHILITLQRRQDQGNRCSQAMELRLSKSKNHKIFKCNHSWPSSKPHCRKISGKGSIIFASGLWQILKDRFFWGQGVEKNNDFIFTKHNVLKFQRGFNQSASMILSGYDKLTDKETVNHWADSSTGFKQS